ncbi:MAG: hypothetical protein IPM38_10520 [Ignavibacteria bacterium]|nr:hypothetical protein [Ignavibacteria bacterium]
MISASSTRDIDNEIGVLGETANTITNWGGSTIAADGIRCEGQINLKIINNVINGGNGTASAVVGISLHRSELQLLLRIMRSVTT